MIHTAQGWWLDEAGEVEPRPHLNADIDADILVLGGGYTGMWAAWFIKEAAPGAKVVILERDLCGHGPSGRNGGFVNGLWFSLASMTERFGADGAEALAVAGDEAVLDIGAWCEATGVDAWFRQSGYMQVSTSPYHDALAAATPTEAAAAGFGEYVHRLSPEQVAEHCRSPVFRGGAFYPVSATVQPARLALGLRGALINLGVRIFENSDADHLDLDGDQVIARTASGSVRAGSAVLATGLGLLKLKPLRRRLTGASSHMVVTEPVPDLLEEIGWTGGEAITAEKVLINYFRTTPDGRIVFGWGGGRVVRGADTGGLAEIDPDVVDALREQMLRIFPGLKGRRIEQAWGGPIDVSPVHLPVVASVGDRAFAAFGYTGNGVASSNMCGRILASLALDKRDSHTRLAIVDPEPTRVPPEPFRHWGGALIRGALVRRERAEDEGRRPGFVDRLLSDIPRRVGIHIVR